ncbi:MAG: DUF3089 domain-containing protein [Candidatus Margulisiibacteriota bacterium]
MFSQASKVCGLGLICAMALVLGCGSTVSAASVQPLDYGVPSNWAALPGKDSGASFVPDGYTVAGASAGVDLFYLYPTWYEGPEPNAEIDNPDTQDVVDFMLKTQASAFNGCAQIYAPYYRQISLQGFDTGAYSKAQRAAFAEKAYGDVKAAFAYYLAHHNQGRRFFILGHSQGSQMAVRLIKETLDGTPLQKQLICAYLIGERVGTQTFSVLKLGQTPTENQCFVSYATFEEGADPGRSSFLTGAYLKGSPLCVNPFTWTATSASQKPTVASVGLQEDLVLVQQPIEKARVAKGVLFITHPRGEFDADGKDYHLSDINLFWGDIRANAQLRAAQTP